MEKLFYKLYSEGQERFFDVMKDNLLNDNKMFIVTANSETFILSEEDKELNELLYDDNTIMVPDGIGVVYASKKLGNNVKERITGIDIAIKLLEYCDEYKKSLYLFGSKQEVIDLMNNKISILYPSINLLGSSNGYIKNKDKAFDEIAKLKPDVVLVALGIPKQEKIIYKHLNKFKKGIFVGVGGSFDVISGSKKRASKLFIKMNLEWLYRIIKEPKRIKRFWNNNVKFFLKMKVVVREKNNRTLSKM